MSNRFIQLTSGWIPVSVLLLFAAALVMGQDTTAPVRGDRPPAVSAEPVATPGLPEPDDLAGPESLRHVADSVSPVPEIIGVSSRSPSHTDSGRARPENGQLDQGVPQ